MRMIWAPSFTIACGGICAFSLIGEVKRTVSESPYIRALATILRRDVMAYGPIKFFQTIFGLLVVGLGNAMVVI
jgi:hypothetical protein